MANGIQASQIATRGNTNTQDRTKAARARGGLPAASTTVSPISALPIAAPHRLSQTLKYMTVVVIVHASCASIIRASKGANHQVSSANAIAVVGTKMTR